MVWIYSVSDLPDDMLTQKGRRAIVEVGMHRSATRAFARTDDAEPRERVKIEGDIELNPEIVRRAAAVDAMGFLRNLRRIRVIPDRDQWHGQTDRGCIDIEAKFCDLPPMDQMHVLMHEIGHLGQDSEPALFREFKRKHVASLGAFEAMANQIHLDDLRRRGVVDGGLAAEVFAESYARFVLGLDLPAELGAFWRARPTGLMSQREAVYGAWWPNRITRCGRCSMFVPGVDPRHNRCTAVEGPIALHGHCRQFEISGARTDSAEADRTPAVGAEALRRRLARIDQDLERIKEDIG